MNPRVLGRNFASAEVYVPAHRLLAQADGPGHMDECVQGVAAQPAIDSRFNTSALQKACRVLRLHYKDAELGDTLIHCTHALSL